MANPASADGCTARLYSPAWRVVGALLAFVSRVSLPLILVLVLLATDPPVGPILLVQLVAACAALPALAAHLIRRVRTARVELTAGDLVVRRSGLLMEIPANSIARIAPWAMPLPEPALVLWMRSGSRLRDAIALDDLAPLLDGLAAMGIEAAATARRHPTVAYAQAAAGQPTWRWYHYLWKFVGFALAPTAVLFNAHQYIAYGGTFGEYYLFGLAPYLRTFTLYWVLVAIHLVLYAGLWRAVVESAALLAAWVVPRRAAGARNLAERSCQALYYGGVPALIALRFLS